VCESDHTKLSCRASSLCHTLLVRVLAESLGLLSFHSLQQSMDSRNSEGARPQARSRQLHKRHKRPT